MRVLVTGGTGVLGRAFRPLAEAAGHDVWAPGRAGLDLFGPLAVGAAVRDVDAVLHLATRIQPLGRMGQPGAWRENDRLRAEGSAILVDAALAADVKTYVQPTVTFVYPGDRFCGWVMALGWRGRRVVRCRVGTLVFSFCQGAGQLAAAFDPELGVGAGQVTLDRLEGHIQRTS